MAFSMKQIGLAAAMAVGTALAAAMPAKAAFVTTQEAGMDAVYSQSSFGNAPIDIRFSAQQTLVAPNLLDITTNAQIFELFDLRTTPQNVVNFYYIDSISACGVEGNALIVGCAELPGNDFVVESNAAAGSNGAELLAHELAHNLGVDHRTAADALMNEILNGGTVLNAVEVDIIRGSNLIQQDQEGFFINVQPVLIVSGVPLPATAFMLIGGLAAFAAVGRRRRAAA